MRLLARVLRPDREDELQVWLNPNHSLVITRYRRGEPAPITVKLTRIKLRGDPPLKRIRLRSQTSVVVE